MGGQAGGIDPGPRHHDGPEAGNGPPGLGDDNDRVLASLGYAPEEIADLARASVIADEPPAA